VEREAREGPLEAEERAPHVPGHPGARDLLGQRPGLGAEVVAPRGVLAGEGRAIGVSEVRRVGEGNERLPERGGARVTPLLRRSAAHAQGLRQAGAALSRPDPQEPGELRAAGVGPVPQALPLDRRERLKPAHPVAGHRTQDRRLQFSRRRSAVHRADELGQEHRLDPGRESPSAALAQRPHQALGRREVERAREAGAVDDARRSLQPPVDPCASSRPDTDTDAARRAAPAAAAKSAGSRVPMRSSASSQERASRRPRTADTTSGSASSPASPKTRWAEISYSRRRRRDDGTPAPTRSASQDASAGAEARTRAAQSAGRPLHLGPPGRRAR